MAVNNGNAYQNNIPQYGQQMFGMPQNQMGMNYGNQGMMNTMSRPGLSVVPIDDDNQITNYPVASGNTVMFVNFNTNRLCFKSTNVNGVTMPPQWASFTYDQVQNNFQQTNQNAGQMVTRQEFDELRNMMQETLNAIQNKGFRPKPKYDKSKGGARNDQSNGIPANDE